MKDWCLTCGGQCCMGIIDVQTTDPVFSDKRLTVEQEGKGLRRMRTNADHRCIALVYGLCSIYEKRPQACRDFQVGNRVCLNVRAGRLNSHKNGFNLGEMDCFAKLQKQI